MMELQLALSHAKYVGFGDIEYEKIDFSALRNAESTDGLVEARQGKIKAFRQHEFHDIGVFAVFQQTWGNTALGHGGIGGSAITTAYTIVLESLRTGEYLVYFGGRFCYRVPLKSENLRVFIQDCHDHNLAGKSESGKYY